MALKKLAGQETKADSKKEKAQNEDKPNVRDYIKAEAPKDGDVFVVEKCKLTDSGWLIIETTEWVGFIHGKAAVAKSLMNEIAPALHGTEANQLVALIHKKSKFGFVLATEDTVKWWYHYTPDSKLLEIYEVQPEHFLLPTGVLSLEDFIDTKSSS